MVIITFFEPFILAINKFYHLFEHDLVYKFFLENLFVYDEKVKILGSLTFGPWWYFFPILFGFLFKLLFLLFLDFGLITIHKVNN